MFKLLFQIVLIVYTVLLFFNILDLKKYNKNGIIRNCEKIEDVIAYQGNEVQVRLYNSD